MMIECSALTVICHVSVSEALKFPVAALAEAEMIYIAGRDLDLDAVTPASQ